MKKIKIYKQRSVETKVDIFKVFKFEEDKGMKIRVKNVSILNS